MSERGAVSVISRSFILRCHESYCPNVKAAGQVSQSMGVWLAGSLLRTRVSV